MKSRLVSAGCGPGRRPEGPSFISPGHSPGYALLRNSSPERAEHGMFDSSARCRPFRAFNRRPIYPGLCPGLMNDAPLGLGNGALIRPTIRPSRKMKPEVRA